MSETGPRPAKRQRGSYAKLICLRCRERRIKCSLPVDGSVEPSSEPQPAEKACARCKQQGLACIVRKTTLGRPNQKKQSLPTPSSTESNWLQSRSPSPYTEDLVLLNVDNERGDSARERRASVLPSQPASVQMFGAINRTFNLTSALLARDKRFGSSISELKDIVPPPLEEMLSEDLTELLDRHLVWHRIYMPWIPNLSTLHKEVIRNGVSNGTNLPSTLLLALLSSIALDVPSDSLAPYRRLQRDLRCHVFHSGQKVLFTLPGDEYTLTALELVHGHRPLALVDSQEAATHTLSGNLFGTLVNALQHRLGLNTAPSKLRTCLDNGSYGPIPYLVRNTLRWCTSLMFRIWLDLEEIDTKASEVYQPARDLTCALQAVAETIDLGLAPSDCFFLFHVLRYHSDDIFAIRHITADWTDLEKLAAHVDAHTKLAEQRKGHIDEGLRRFFYSQGQLDEGLALSQLANTEQNLGNTKVIGLASFFAIMSGAQTMSNGEHSSVAQLSRFYTDRVNEAASGRVHTSATYAFLDRYGDMHMDGLEKILTDFINVASDLQFKGIPYVGPSRQTTANILMACKEIVENNAVRIKIDRCLHSRVDMQLILFQEAARRLEAMEADGGSTDAVARGSVFTASAKLIRNLHRIMWHWKRNYAIPPQQQQTEPPPAIPKPTGHGYDEKLFRQPEPLFGLNIDDSFDDGFFAQWENWPQLGPTEFADMFTYDFDLGNV